MRKCLATVLFGILLSLNAGVGIALADTASIRMTNSTPETIFFNLYSRSRTGFHWPAGGKRWVLNPGQKGTVVAGECQPNELICYGAANKDRSRSWGVSLSGKSGCANCCTHCGKSQGWNLTERTDPPPHPHNSIDDGPALQPADD
jgi:hypothetical protein